MLLSISSAVGIAIDVAIVALLVIFAFIGLHKGFFKSVLSMISTLVVVVVSIYFASPLAKLINKIYDFTGIIAGKIAKSLAGMGSFYVETIPEGVSGADIINNIPASTNGFLKKLMSYVLKPLSSNDIQGATVADIVSGAFASIIMTIIAGILLFILIKIVVALASRLFDNITRNRVFGTINKLFGFIFGAVKGLIIVVVFAVVLTLLTVVPVVNNNISPIIQDHTKIARPIYNYTDEWMEKFVVEGKILQKWVDNLWENKYKGKEDNSTLDTGVTPDGTLDKPYQIELIEAGTGIFTATITIDFSSSDVKYYELNPSEQVDSYFNLDFTTDAGYKVYDSEDTTVELTNLTSLNDNNRYIIKFTKSGEQTSVNANLTITQNKI